MSKCNPLTEHFEKSFMAKWTLCLLFKAHTINCIPCTHKREITCRYCKPHTNLLLSPWNPQISHAFSVALFGWQLVCQILTQSQLRLCLGHGCGPANEQGRDEGGQALTLKSWNLGYSKFGGKAGHQVSTQQKQNWMNWNELSFTALKTGIICTSQHHLITGILSFAFSSMKTVL